MRGFNNDKLWQDFEASGCVGDYLNYRVSKLVPALVPATDETRNDKTIAKDCYNGFKDNRSRIKATQPW